MREVSTKCLKKELEKTLKKEEDLDLFDDEKKVELLILQVQTNCGEQL